MAKNKSFKASCPKCGLSGSIKTEPKAKMKIKCKCGHSFILVKKSSITSRPTQEKTVKKEKKDPDLNYLSNKEDRESNHTKESKKTKNPPTGLSNGVNYVDDKFVLLDHSPIIGILQIIIGGVVALLAIYLLFEHGCSPLPSSGGRGRAPLAILAVGFFLVVRGFSNFEKTIICIDGDKNSTKIDVWGGGKLIESHPSLKICNVEVNYSRAPRLLAFTGRNYNVLLIPKNNKTEEINNLNSSSKCTTWALINLLLSIPLSGYNNQAFF